MRSRQRTRQAQRRLAKAKSALSEDGEAATQVKKEHQRKSRPGLNRAARRRLHATRGA